MKTPTIIDLMRAKAETAGIPLVSLAQAKDTLCKAKKTGADFSMARLMAKHGRLTDEAREYVSNYNG